MALKNIQAIINKHYDQLFQEVIDANGDDLYELVVEYQSQGDGLTVRRSWRDREERLKEKKL
jgi:hypothetical protein